MEWADKTVLVTGAGGFIGSHLVERCLALGADVKAFMRYNSVQTCGWLDNSPVRAFAEMVFGDVRDFDTVKRAMRGVDIVFHLAALIDVPYSEVSPRSYVETNVGGTLNVLQAAAQSGVKRVVLTSTSEVYGTAQTVPMTEAHRLHAQSPYAASKVGADALGQALYRSTGLPVVTLRPFNTYGPRQSLRAVIPSIIVQALTQPTIRLGNLTPTRDFVYVTDTVAAFLLMAEQGPIGEVVHVGTGVDITIGELAGMILALMGVDKPIVEETGRQRSARSEVQYLRADATKARTVLGWEPTVSLEAGLQQTIAWITERVEWSPAS